VLSNTSTEHAPWYVIPADRKWFARVGAAAVLVKELMDIDPRFPVVTKQQRDALADVKRELEAEAPEGAAADPFEAEQQHEPEEPKQQDQPAEQSTAAPSAAGDGGEPAPARRPRRAAAARTARTSTNASDQPGTQRRAS
jgi:hypothetical protein